MKKTLLITIVAIVLILSVAGTCFALYKQAATDKVIPISATSGAVITCNLDINNTTLDFSDISPADGHRTKTADVKLTSNNNEVAKGIAGIFKVTKAGELAPYVDITVNAIAALEAQSVGEPNTDALTENGATLLVTDNKCFRITMTLNDNGCANFASIAEKTGSITVSWTLDTRTTTLDYDADAFYVIGTVNGSTAWFPNTGSLVLETEDIPSGNIAYLGNVALKNGDEFKIVRDYRGTGNWSGTQSGNSSVDGITVSDNNANIRVTKDGNYDIYVNADNQVWVAVHPAS